MANKFSVEAVFKGVDKFSAPVSRMDSKIKRFTQSMRRGFDRMNRSVKKLSERMASGFKRGAIALAGVVTAVSIAIKKVADRADDLSKQAKILNLPIEQLQEWQFVAEQSGVSADSLTKSLGILDKQVGQAKTGTGTLVTMLKKSNPVLLKQLLHVKNTGAAFNLVIDALRKIKDPTQRANLATAAFGRQGLALINIATTSAKALKALREEARKNGLITQAQATAAEAFNDQLNSLSHTFTGVLQGALLPLMPIFRKYLELTQQWIFSNKKLIGQGITEFVVGVGKAIAFLARHGKLILGVTAAFFGLMAALRTFIVVMTAVNLIMDANPVALIVIGVIALVAAVIFLVLKFKKLRDFFKKLWKTAVTVFDAIVSQVKKILSSFNPLVKLEKIIARIFSHARTGKPIKIQYESDFSKLAPETTGIARQMISPQDRIAKTINETKTTNTSEVTIKDTTGTASLTKGVLGAGINLQPSGAFQ